MNVAILTTATAVFTLIAYQDMKFRRISNRLSAVIALLGLVRILVDPNGAGLILLSLVAASGFFAVGFLLFSVEVLGGGDAKLASATAWLVGWHDILLFLILMSLFGAVLALSALALSHSNPTARGISERPEPTHPAEASKSRWGQRNVPYGAAIAAGGVTTLILQLSPR